MSEGFKNRTIIFAALVIAVGMIVSATIQIYGSRYKLLSHSVFISDMGSVHKLYRLDRLSGRVWELNKDDKWIEVNLQIEIAQTDPQILRAEKLLDEFRKKQQLEEADKQP